MSDIKLPPLPSPPKEKGHQVFAFHQMQAYAIAAIEADRQARGEPCLTCNDNGAVGNILNAEPCPDCTPQPQQQASGWPKVNGVGRVLGSEQSLEVYFDSEPSDDQLRAVHNFLTSPQPQQIPEGYKLVPIEPTEEMLFACQDAGSISNHQRGKRIYKAMLEAAPEPVGEQAK